MEIKKLQIPSDEDKIYKQILTVFKFITNLSDQENDVLAELIKFNHDYIALPSERRARFLMSTDIRKEIRERLNIEEKQYNSLLARLKNKKILGTPVLNDKGELNPFLFFKYDKEGFKLELILEIQSKKKQAVKEPKVETISTEEMVEEVVEQESVPSTNSYEIKPGPPEETETFDVELL